VLFLLIGEIDGGLWITLPSAQDGCGSLQEDSYFWDTPNIKGYLYNEHIPGFPRGSVPKGEYYFYYNSTDDPVFLYSDVRQYFCTMKVDSMPVGSYCFYQNIQNCKYHFLIVWNIESRNDQIAQSCPLGFDEGILIQDDEDTNNQSGPNDTTITTLPKRENTYFTNGSYIGTIDTTKWFFCCGNGTTSMSISFDPIRSQLPDSFVLFRRGGSCQVINGRNFQASSVV